MYPLRHVLADIQHQESDKYVFMFMYILPDSKKVFKIVILNTIEIIV